MPAGMRSFSSQVVGLVSDMGKWLDQHVVTLIGIVVAAGVAWYVYRDNVHSQRGPYSVRGECACGPLFGSSPACHSAREADPTSSSR